MQGGRGTASSIHSNMTMSVLNGAEKKCTPLINIFCHFSAAQMTKWFKNDSQMSVSLKNGGKGKLRQTETESMTINSNNIF